MTLFALQFFLAYACKCQVMLSTVWFSLTRPKRSRPKGGMNTEKKNVSESKCIYLLESACKISII